MRTKICEQITHGSARKMTGWKSKTETITCSASGSANSSLTHWWSRQKRLNAPPETKTKRGNDDEKVHI